MAVLIPITNPKYSAFYDSGRQQLDIEITGEIPSVVLSCEIRRDPWVGGLHYSLVGFYGGLGKHPDSKHIDIKYTDHVRLPIPHFNNKSVLIETANETVPVDIRYGGLNPPLDPPAPEDPAKPEQPIGPFVLPPIKIFLPGGTPGEHTSAIPAALSEGWGVHVSFDHTDLGIWSAQATPKDIRYILTWMKTPKDIENPVIFEVITERVLLQTDGGEAITAGTVQPYLVYYALLGSQK